MRNRVDKEGLVMNYFRVKEYSHRHKKHEVSKDDSDRLFHVTDPYEGEKHNYIAYFLYDSGDPISDKDKIRVIVGFHQIQNSKVKTKSSSKPAIYFFDAQDLEKMLHYDDVK